MPGILFAGLILLPVLTALLITRWGAGKRTRKGMHLVVGAALALQCALSALLLSAGDRSLLLFQLGPALPFALRSDGLARFFVPVISVLWALNGVYAFKYMEHIHDEKSFFVYYMLILGALTALCLAASPVMMLAFFGAVIFLSAPLYTLEKNGETAAARRRYLIYALLCAVLCAAGLLLTLPAAGNPYFTRGGSLITEEQTGASLLAGAFMACLGFSGMAGMFPLQRWLSAAHPAAAAPASAALSGVIAKAGILCLIRYLYYVLGPGLIRGSWVQTALLSFAAATVLMGSMLALGQDVLKKRLAYSSMSQLSYILCGVFLLTPAAFEGALLHVFFHAVTKSALYMCAGAVIFCTGRTEVSRLEGMGSRMPVTMTLFTAASLGLVGIPPMGGFISKWFLIEGALAPGAPRVFGWLVPAALLVSALLTAGYLLPVSIRAFHAGHGMAEDGGLGERIRLSPLMAVPMVALTAALAGFGLFPGSLIGFFRELASGLM